MEAEEGDDHYAILGLPSGEEGAKLTQEELKRGYHIKALVCHPDKRRDDPLAHAAFQKLTSSYEILKNPDTRKAFDALLRVRRDRLLRRSQTDSKRRRMMSDLEERERAAFPVDPEEKAQKEEEMAAKKFQEEVARIRELHEKKRAEAAAEVSGEDLGLDKERILKVSWERAGEDYSAASLKELFGVFDEVEDVVIRGKGSKRRSSALVIMATKAAAVAAVQNMRCDLSNPLLVNPLNINASEPSSASAKYTKPDPPNLSNLVGAGYQAHEDSILMKLRKA